MTDPLAKHRKRWAKRGSNWPDPWIHADIITRDDPIHSPNLVNLNPNAKRAMYNLMPDDLKRLLEEFRGQAEAVYFEPL